MNSKPVLFVVLTLGATAARAGGAPYPEPTLAENGADRSRAEVAAELRTAAQLGLLVQGEADVKRASAAQEQQIADAGRDAARQRLLRQSASVQSR